MSELDLAFKEYCDQFKKLKKTEKRQEIISSVKELIVFLDALGIRDNMKLSYLKSKEILDLNNGFESEDDYLEALLVYIENAKVMLGEYLSNKI